MHFVDYNTKKERQSHCRFEVFLDRAMTPDNLCLAIKSVLNFSYLRRLCARGQGSANLF